MEGGGLRSNIVSVAASAIAMVLILTAFAVSYRSERASPVFLQAAPPAGTYFDFVVAILMENHGICDILTYCGGNAPFETQLANESGLATNYGPSPCGKSLVDYLCLTGASTFGCTENPNPNSDACTRRAWQSPNIVDRLVDAGLTWKAYMENMTSTCGSPAGPGYVIRHNACAYYGDIATNATRCARVVPAEIDDRALLDDLGSPSNASDYMWLTPNVCNDMDVCPVAAGDAYLSTLIPKILGSTVFTTERAALFITFDEAAQGRGAPAIYTLWSGPAAKVGYTSSVPYNHFSHLATIEANWNLPPLNANDSGARNMSEFFVGSQPDFSLSASPWSLSFIEGGSGVSNVGVHPQNGFQGAVTLDATASPVGVTAVCTPSVISAGASSACAMSSSTAGSFDVTVSGTAGTGVNRVTIHVQVIGLLSAQFTFSPSNPFSSEPVDFSGSAAGGQSPYDYSWQLGDESTMTGDRVSHVYSSEGAYRVNLTIHDGRYHELHHDGLADSLRHSERDCSRGGYARHERLVHLQCDRDPHRVGFSSVRRLDPLRGGRRRLAELLRAAHAARWETQPDVLRLRRFPKSSGTKSSCERERRHDAARGPPRGPCAGGHILNPGALDRIRYGIRHRGV